MDNRHHNNKSLSQLILGLADKARRMCSSEDIIVCQELILCFARDKMFQNGEYAPDPSNSNCYYYDQVWNILSPAWQHFRSACEDDLVQTLDEIQQRKFSKEMFTKLFEEYLHSAAKLGDSISTQPDDITRLAIAVMQYDGGTVYNPFAGTASYGTRLKIGERYIGEELNARSWAIGTMRLLLHGSPSWNYICGDSAQHLKLAEMVTEQYDFIISTPPFNQKIGEDNRYAEDMLLSGFQDLLTDSGKMVAFVPAGIGIKGGSIQAKRALLTESGCLDTVIALPKQAFAPSTHAQTLLLVLRKQGHNDTVRMFDARDLIKRGAADVDRILERLHNIFDKDIHYIGVDELRENGYCWIPGRYVQETKSAPYPDQKTVRLSDILTSVKKEYADGAVHSIQVKDFSSDPFDCYRQVESFPVVPYYQGGVSLNAVEQNSDREAQALEMILSTVSAELDSLQKKKYELQRDFAEKDERLEQKFTVESNHLQEEIARLSDDLSATINKIKSAKGGFISGEVDLEELSVAQAQQTEIIARINQLEETRKQADKVYGEQKRASVELAASRIKSVDNEINDLSRKLAITKDQLKLLHERASRHPDVNHYMVRMDRSAIIIGGNRPKAKFLYLEKGTDGLTSVCFPPSYHIFYLERKDILPEYLIFRISEKEFKDIGDGSVALSLDDILNICITLPSVDEQGQFINEQKGKLNPYRLEVDELRQKLAAAELKAKQEEETLLASMGAKQHDLGNLTPKLTAKFADLYDSLCELPDEIDSKDAMLRQVLIISEEIKDMNKLIKTISEKEPFPEAIEIDPVDFLSRYTEGHPGNGYEVSFLYDRQEIEELGGQIFISISDIGLTRALMNIRDNAEMHGFAPDTTGASHHFRISLHLDSDRDMCIIDFSNNGLPMEKGMTAAIYGTKGEKSKTTGHTGFGGWEVAEMARFYHGTYDINPEGDADGWTTIRLTFPICHD